MRIYFGGAKANVIHMDEGATNGVMHIIDQLLFVNDDLTRDVSAGGHVTFTQWLILGTILITQFLRFLRWFFRGLFFLIVPQLSSLNDFFINIFFYCVHSIHDVCIYPMNIILYKHIIYVFSLSFWSLYDQIISVTFQTCSLILVFVVLN